MSTWHKNSNTENIVKWQNGRLIKGVSTKKEQSKQQKYISEGKPQTSIFVSKINCLQIRKRKKIEQNKILQNKNVQRVFTNK